MVEPKVEAAGIQPALAAYPEFGVGVISFQHLDDCPVCDVLDPHEP